MHSQGGYHCLTVLAARLLLGGSDVTDAVAMLTLRWLFKVPGLLENIPRMDAVVENCWISYTIPHTCYHTGMMVCGTTPID